MGKYMDELARYEREREWLNKPFSEMTAKQKRWTVILYIGCAVVVLAGFFAPVG